MSSGLIGAMAEALDSMHALQTNARYRSNAVAFVVTDEISKHIADDAEAQARLHAMNTDSHRTTQSADPLAKAVLTALNCFGSFWRCYADDRSPLGWIGSMNLLRILTQ